MNEHPSYRYARAAADGKLTDAWGRPTSAPAYVVKQCREFVEICDGESGEWMVDVGRVRVIDNILKLLVMPKGLKAGRSIYECTMGYQWLIYVAIFCVVYRGNPAKRRYETAVLEICRKNFKTYTVAIIFIIAFLLEPAFSKFYSVAPDGALSREVQEAISETLKSSPAVYQRKGKSRFKILRDYIKFLPTETKYIPLNYTNSRFDGRLPNGFLADEVGALPNSYAVESMRSGQLNVVNKLGCIISTKYPTFDNPFEDEVDYAKKVLDGIQCDPTVFALLFEPDETKEWMSDDLIMQQGNPAALEIPEIWEDLVKKRSRAIASESARENFLPKHCNIVYQCSTESYVPIDAVRAGALPGIDFAGRELYVGVDLAMTNDNCAVAVAYEEDDEIYCDVKAFFPADRQQEKSMTEKIDYQLFVDAGCAIPCGGMVVDYSEIERFVEGIEREYGGTVVSVGYDRFNAISSVGKWEAAGLTCVEIKQHSSVLHPPTKLLSEKIEGARFHYRPNRLLEINFQNARCTYDTNLNRYVNKKRSNGKVDMVAALLNAVYLLQQDIIFGDDFIAQY